jgi:SagB-type dehydrogenase family enzyme
MVLLVPDPTDAALDLLPINSARSGLPTRPAVVRDLVLVPFRDGIIVDGLVTAHVLSGRLASTILTDLLSLCDGMHTVAEIERSFSAASTDSIRIALALLFEKGVIEEGSQDCDTSTIISPETLAFCGRFAASTGANSNGRQAYDRLERAELVLVTPEPSSDSKALEDFLRTLGIVQIRRVTLRHLDGLRLSATRTPKLVVLSSLAGESIETSQTLDEWCYRHNLAWLRVVCDVTDGYADIGPLFHRFHSCYQCFASVHGRPPRLSERQVRASMSTNHFWLGMIAAEIVYLLTKLGPALSIMGAMRYDLKSWTSEHLRCTRIPGCSRCRPGVIYSPDRGRDSDDRTYTDTAIVYEDFVGLESYGFTRPKTGWGIGPVSDTANLQTKSLPNSAEYLLSTTIVLRDDIDTLALLGKGEVSPSSAVTRGAIEAILMYTAGMRDSIAANGTPRRWSASAGNLGSVELFVLVRRLDGLPDGLYFYQSGRHSLARMTSRDDIANSPEIKIRRIFPHSVGELPDVVLLFTGAYHRLSKKYGAVAYRLMQLDAGVAISQCLLAAKSVGLFAEAPVRWPDDVIAEAIHLDLSREHVTGVVSFYSTRPLADPQALRAISASGGAVSMVNHKPARSFFEVSEQDVAEMLCRESRMCERSLAQCFCTAVGSEESLRRDDASVTLLPQQHLTGGSPFAHVLRERRSVRHYDARDIDLNQIGKMLASTFCTNDHECDALCLLSSARIGIMLLLQRSAILSPGVYEYLSDLHALRFVRSALTQEERQRLFVNTEFSQAPLVVWVVGDLASICARAGAVGHRLLLLRAGRIVHRLSLAAGAIGLGGTIVAGVVPSAAQTLLGIDGFYKASLVAFAAGHPSKSARVPPAPTVESNWSTP